MENLSRRTVIETAIKLSVIASRGPSDHAAKTEKPNAKEETMAEPENKVLQEMARRAKNICDRAYCPYSKFRVGAVVLTDDGQMFEGCNIENASYGLTICAERNAVFQMVARAKRKIAAVVIYTPTPAPSAPCGACRQVINEFGPDALIVSNCDGAASLRKTLSELLPEAFGPANLNEKK